jgi:hypothetical protein
MVADLDVDVVADVDATWLLTWMPHGCHVDADVDAMWLLTWMLAWHATWVLTWHATWLLTG